MNDDEYSDDRIHHELEGIDGPLPPRPTSAISTEWPEGEDVVALRVSWSADSPRRYAYTHREIAASLDGIHPPSLKATGSTETRLSRHNNVGGSAVDDSVEVPFRDSRPVLSHLVAYLQRFIDLDSGVEVNQVDLDQLKRESPPRGRYSWCVVLFFGTDRASGSPVPRRAMKFTSASVASAEDVWSFVSVASALYRTLSSLAQLVKEESTRSDEPQPSPFHSINDELNAAAQGADWDSCATLLDEYEALLRTASPGSTGGASLLALAQAALHDRRDLAERAIELHRRNWPGSQSGLEAARWLEATPTKQAESGEPDADEVQSTSGAPAPARKQNRKRNPPGAQIGSPTMNHYEVLQVPRDAEVGEIHAAYRLQLSVWHPDKHDGTKLAEEAERRTKLIADAWEALRHKSSRAAYDETVFGSDARQDSGSSTEELADANDGSDGSPSSGPDEVWFPASPNRPLGLLLVVLGVPILLLGVGLGVFSFLGTGDPASDLEGAGYVALVFVSIGIGLVGAWLAETGEKYWFKPTGASGSRRTFDDMSGDYAVWFAFIPLALLLLASYWPNSEVGSRIRDYPITAFAHAWGIAAIGSWVLGRPYAGQVLDGIRWLAVALNVLVVVGGLGAAT